MYTDLATDLCLVAGLFVFTLSLTGALFPRETSEALGEILRWLRGEDR